MFIHMIFLLKEFKKFVGSVLHQEEKTGRHRKICGLGNRFPPRQECHRWREEKRVQIETRKLKN